MPPQHLCNLHIADLRKRAALDWMPFERRTRARADDWCGWTAGAKEGVGDSELAIADS